MTCTNHLKQLALACHNHADAKNGGFPVGGRGWNFLTWTSFILPYIEQQARYSQMSIIYNNFEATNPSYPAPSDHDLALNTGRTANNNPEEAGRLRLEQNLRVFEMSQAPVMICPTGPRGIWYFSETEMNRGFPKVSYAGCAGATAVNEFALQTATTMGRAGGWVADYRAFAPAATNNGQDRINAEGALFGINSIIQNSGSPPANGGWATEYHNRQRNAQRLQTNGGIQMSYATDGLSNTILFSEILQAQHDVAHSRLVTGAFNADARGGGRPDGILFSTYFEPNTTQPDELLLGATHCHTADSPVTPGAYCRGPESGTTASSGNRLSARSHHTGGVNAARGDGSVFFVPNTVSRQVWRALGSARSGESVSL
jgi:hypothetical protein